MTGTGLLVLFRLSLVSTEGVVDPGVSVTVVEKSSSTARIGVGVGVTVGGVPAVIFATLVAQTTVTPTEQIW